VVGGVLPVGSRFRLTTCVDIGGCWMLDVGEWIGSIREEMVWGLRAPSTDGL
jgi:hypothetical protein